MALTFDLHKVKGKPHSQSSSACMDSSLCWFLGVAHYLPNRTTVALAAEWKWNPDMPKSTDTVNILENISVNVATVTRRQWFQDVY